MPRLKSIFVFATGVFSVIYILNPTMGVIELIPDNLPIIGNLDEAGAVMLLLSCLRYFGYDFKGLFERKIEEKEDDDDKTIEG